MTFKASLSAFSVGLAILLTGCGQSKPQTSKTKDVADCHSIFQGRVYLSVGSYSGYLNVYPNGTGLLLASVETGDGLEASCGRSDASGPLSYSYVPFTPDYSLRLDLTSASCGDRRIVITGDCQSNGSATAELNGAVGYIVPAN